jgi:hypothetical protein
VSAPRKHPIGELIATAEETVRIMWRAYEAHLSLSKRDADWEIKAGEIYQRCTACVDRLWQLRELRSRSSHPKSDSRALPETQGSAGGPPAKVRSIAG